MTERALGRLHNINKAFLLNLNRSGTQSVHDHFIRAGLSTVHWPAVVDGIDYERQVMGREHNLDFVADLLGPVFARATAASDVPVPVLDRQLEKRYENARFLSVRRESGEWVSSVRRHIGGRTLHPFEKVQYFQYLSG
jgi:hypothetical protein